ncbi:MAG: nitroreductase [Planctomycetaceae bacterium]|nr:nitroreductase [Planctomycetaceae bacterium]
MNDVITAILERRSIRKYKPDQISDADRDLIVKAGLHAASAKNTQPWHITVVQNDDLIREITRQTKAAILRANVERYLALANNENYAVNYGAAPTFMIVGADPKVSACPVEDGTLVLGNMMLAAYSLGIGSCWINQPTAVCDEPEFRAFLTSRLSFPAEMKIVGSCAFGYSAVEHPKAPPRKEGTVNIVR